jgi:UDP-N-acetylmuramoyl-tripeptide--D-alanyl-D-alanine ligase
MPTTLTLDDILLALVGCPPAESELLRGDAPLAVQVAVDSRHCVPGSVFVALRGENVDGHLYVPGAFARGAIAAIVEEPTGCEVALDLRERGTRWLRQIREEGISSVWAAYSPPLCLVVDDSLAALQALAAWWRARIACAARPAPKVIGITGSVGKTTTKEYVASVLAQRYRVLKSQGNYNNEIGLPLTLLQLDDRCERVVLEMGTYGPGEITLLARLSRPQIGIVTNVGPVHLERMGTLERIAQAKAELPQALPRDGTAILNADDERVRAMARQTEARTFLYGLAPGCDLWADEVQSRGLEGLQFRFHHGGKSIHAVLPLLGQHSVYTALRAAAVGLVEGLSWDEILAGLRAGDGLRLAVVPGVNGTTLLDDTYNSSPDSAIAALNLLDELAGRKVAVLGDMLELGEYALEGHRRVGCRAAGVVSLLVTVGELGRLIGEEAKGCGMPPERVIHLQDNEQTVSCLRHSLQAGDQVLIKGSRGMSMEQIVAALARPPSTGSTEGAGRTR